MKSLFVKAIARITPSCQHMSRLCSESLERNLSMGDRMRMKMHCWICSWCIDYSKQVHKVSSTVHQEAESLAELKNDQLSDECKARMRTIMVKSSNDSSTND